MRIVFMGSPEFAVPSLETLQRSSHEILAVVTQPDRPKGRNLQTQPPAVKIAAGRFKIPILQPSTTKSETFLADIKSLNPELLVVVAYGEILRSNLLALPQYGAVNLHGSLLPKFRGAAPVAWAILSGEDVTGATTMMMNEAMDAGPILMQQECAIGAVDTAGSLSKKISEMGADLLKRTIDSIARNEIVPIAQDPSQVSFAPKLNKENGRIDWHQNSLCISRQIRAFDPWPGSFTSFRGTKVKLWGAKSVQNETTSEKPGTIVEIDKNRLCIACGEQTLLDVYELQMENRRRSSAADFIHGYSVRRGDTFESTIENGKINF